MSESEEAVFVEKMAEMEAEPFQQDLSDLMNFSESKDTQPEESPVSSSTDQVMDLLHSNEEGNEVSQDTAESSGPTSSTQQVEEVPEQVTSSVVESASAEEQKDDKPIQPDTSAPEKAEKELTSCMAKWLMQNNVDQRVIDLVYWKCWKKTAAIFAGTILILLSLSCCTLLSVFSLYSMCLLAVAFLYRIGMTVFNAVQKTTSEHPFRHLLDQNLDLSEEAVQRCANKARVFINQRSKQLQKLFLIEDVVESIKFGVMLWLISYIGAWFSMMTIAILLCIYIFSVPVLYERHQEQVDSCLATTTSKLKDIFSKIQEKLPEKLKFAKAKED